MQTTVGRWTIEHDPDATRACYARISEVLQCAPCQSCENYLAMGNSNLPTAFWELLEALGITFAKPAEICLACPSTGSNVLNGVWYHSVGRIVAGADVWKPHDDGNSGSWDGEDLAPGVSFGFSSKQDLMDDAFAGQSTIQVEFQVQIPWVLDPYLHPYHDADDPAFAALHPES
jgi:hypothetical protein